MRGYNLPSKPEGVKAKDRPDLEDCCMPSSTTPQVRFWTIDGVRIRYAEHVRLFAVDLPGFAPDVGTAAVAWGGEADG